MRRKKRFTIRLVALGFAVAALGAPAAQAMPEDLIGDELRGLHESQTLAARADEVAAPHGASYSSYSHAPSREPNTALPPQVVDEAGGSEIGPGTFSAIVLLIAVGGGAAIVVREARKGTLARA
jgi:hypothetical protein